MHDLAFDPVPQLRGLEAYSTHRHPAPVDLDLAGNEGPVPSGLGSALAECPDTLWRRYPDRSQVEALLAARLGVEPSSVVLTAGADDALDRVLRTVAGPGRKVLLTDPTFTTLERLARLAGAEVITVPWWSGPFPVERALRSLDPATSAVAVVSPNNPTGSVISASELEALARGIGRRLLLLDHAYVEFAGQDLTSHALRHPNVVVVRTMSKAWGLAGMRLGYAVGSPAVAGLVRAAGQPYPVSAASLAAAAWALENASGTCDGSVRRVRQNRAQLLSELARRGFDAPPGQGNFVFPELGDESWWRDALAGLGIAVRVFPDRPSLRGRVRITVPERAEDVERLLAAVDTVRAPEAVLLDMDGVLADVSGSYREAILATARELGVALRPAEVAAAKAAGGANDDWELTRRLLARRGVERPLAEIVRRFEAHYQGEGLRPGLKERERCLPPVRILERLAARVRLAVVTGRPRRDAGEFLRRHGLEGLFGAVVCMEDGPGKPDPAPVRLAMERLGVSRAWMVGDTPDDVRAARAAGVLPLGVIPPGEAESWRGVLLRAGAARVVDELEELLEVLP